MFEDTEGNPLVLSATHGRALLQQKFDVIFAEVDALFPGELYAVDSTLPGYNFLALHLGFYNKFSENVCLPWDSNTFNSLMHYQGPGSEGPDGHPDDIAKDGVWKINFTQREPRQSLDLWDHPALIRKVQDVFEDLMKLSHDNVSSVYYNHSL